MNPLAPTFDALRRIRRDPNPVMLRELRSSMRTTAFVVASSLGVLFAGFVLLAVATSLGLEDGSTAAIGDVTFQVFLVAVCGIATFLAPILGASAVSAEREAQTFEAILLTGVEPRTLVLGKFAGAYFASAHAIVGCLPLVGISFFYGGVSPVEVFLGVGFVLGLIAPLSAVGIAVSSFVPSTRVAIGVVLAMILPVAMIVLGAMFGISDSLVGSTDGAKCGAFGWLGALAANPLDPEIVLGLFVAPTSAMAIVTWCGLAVAELMSSPAGIVRIRPMQLFHATCTALVLVLQAVALLTMGAADRHDASLAMSLLLAPLSSVAMLFFAAEPIVPPASYVPARRGLRALADAAFRPDAIGTTRYAMVATAVGMFGAVAIDAAFTHFDGGSRFAAKPDARALLALGAGLAGWYVVSAILLHVTAVVRFVAQSGSSLRFGVGLFAVIAGFFLFSLVTLVLALPVIGGSGSSAERFDWIVGFMPFAPIYAAMKVSDGRGVPSWYALFFLAYGGLLVGLRVRLHVAARRAERSRRERRASMEARIREREGRDGAGA